MKDKSKHKESQPFLDSDFKESALKYKSTHDQSRTGFAPVPHFYTELMAKLDLSRLGMRILRVIERQLFGWRKNEAFITIRQFRELSGLKYFSDIIYGIKQLEWQRIILVKRHYGKPSSFRFQPDYTLWRHWNWSKYTKFNLSQESRTLPQEKHLSQESRTLKENTDIKGSVREESRTPTVRRNPEHHCSGGVPNTSLNKDRIKIYNKNRAFDRTDPHFKNGQKKTPTSHPKPQKQKEDSLSKEYKNSTEVRNDVVKKTVEDLTQRPNKKIKRSHSSLDSGEKAFQLLDKELKK